MFALGCGCIRQSGAAVTWHRTLLPEEQAVCQKNQPATSGCIPVRAVRPSDSARDCTVLCSRRILTMERDGCFVIARQPHAAIKSGEQVCTGKQDARICKESNMQKIIGSAPICIHSQKRSFKWDVLGEELEGAILMQLFARQVASHSTRCQFRAISSRFPISPRTALSQRASVS